MPLPSSQFRKNAILTRLRAYRDGGGTLCGFAKEFGYHKGTLSKWDREPEEKAPGKPRGRSRKFHLATPEKLALRALSLKHDSVAFAIQVFRHDPRCSFETRETICAELDAAAGKNRKARWPQTLIAEISPSQEEKDLFRGPKTFASSEHSPRKGMFYIDEHGKETAILSHSVWTMDDYSTNEPYIIETPEGPRLCRQTLCAMDVYSAAWLGVEMIGRERDAYRGEDILRFILRTIEGQGTMPDAFLFERGRWDSIAVHGVKLDALGREFKGETWGALDDLFTIKHGYSSRHKAVIESSFNALQKVLAHSARSMGRFRAEYEFTAKLYLAINDKDPNRKTRPDPRKYEFFEQDAAREAHWMAMQTMNTGIRKRSAEVFEGLAHVPNDLLNDRVPVRPLPDDQRWRFCPIKRLASVRGGFIETQVTHYQGASFRFEVNGITDLYVNNGHRVLIAFDPALPHLGCHIANAEPHSKDGRKVGEFMITARHARDVPMFSLFKGKSDGDNTKKRANAAARTSFAAVNPHKLGLTHTQAHDGEGNALIAQTGAPQPSTIHHPQSPRSGVTVQGGATGPVARLDRNRDDCSTDVEAIAAQRRASLAAAEAALD